MAGRVRTAASVAVCEMAPRPRSAFAKTVLLVTGIAILVHLLRFTARFALGYKKPAQLILSDDDVRIRWHTEVLGRTLGEHDVILPRAEIARAARDVRY